MSTEFCIEHGYEFMRYDRPLIAYCAVCDKVAEVCAAKDARIAELEALRETETRKWAIAEARAEEERGLANGALVRAEYAEKRVGELEAIECPVQINIDEKAKMRIDELTAELRAARAELAEAKLERDSALTDRHDTFADMQTRAEQVESALAAANAKIGEMAAAAKAGGLGWMPVFTRAERAEAESDSLRATIDNMRAMNVKLTYEATGKVLAAEAREKALRDVLLKLVDKPLTDGTSTAALEKDDGDL